MGVAWICADMAYLKITQDHLPADQEKGFKVDDEEKEKKEKESEHLRAQGPFGPIFRPSRPGEHGHGPVVHPKQ